MKSIHNYAKVDVQLSLYTQIHNYIIQKNRKKINLILNEFYNYNSYICLNVLRNFWWTNLLVYNTEYFNRNVFIHVIIKCYSVNQMQVYLLILTTRAILSYNLSSIPFLPSNKDISSKH